MKEKKLSNVFWTEALTGGLTIGVALFVWELIGYWFDMPMKSSGLASFVVFVLLLGGIIFFCRRMRELRGPALGFSYGEVFGFTMGMMLFTGIVCGIGTFFLKVVIAPEYFNEVLEASLWSSNLSEDMIEQALEMQQSSLMSNPAVHVVSGLLSMCVYGGLIGLIVAAFMKRPADPFAENNTPDDYNPQF